MAAGVVNRATPDNTPLAASVLATPDMARMTPAQRALEMKRRKRGQPAAAQGAQPGDNEQMGTAPTSSVLSY